MFLSTAANFGNQEVRLIPEGVGTVARAGAIDSVPGSDSVYCGIYAVYCAAKLLNHTQPSFAELVQPRFVGSALGSTLAELQGALATNNLFGHVISSATPDSLAVWNGPAILHVRSNPRVKNPDHYILFAGVKGDDAVLLDGPRPPAKVPIRDLPAFWDGTAILVSKEPPRWFELFAIQYGNLLCGVVVAAVGLAVAGRLSRLQVVPTSWRRSVVAQTILLLAVAGLLASLLTGFAGDGLLSNATVREYVRRGSSVDFIPRISLADAERMYGRGTRFIDSRSPSEFGAGHVPKAINIFADAELADKLLALRELDRETEIIVYCSHRDCPLAENLAGDLYFAGFHNVKIFAGGWLEWKDHLPIER